MIEAVTRPLPSGAKRAPWRCEWRVLTNTVQWVARRIDSPCGESARRQQYRVSERSSGNLPLAVGVWLRRRVRRNYAQPVLPPYSFR